MIYNAWTILNDSKRPSTVLALHPPTVASARTRAKKFAFLDEIRDFHSPTAFRFTRFRQDYRELCFRLSRLVGTLDFAMPQVCLVDGKKLELMVRDWSSADSATWAADMHKVWVELDHLRNDLDAAREPIIQRTYVSDLSNDILRSMVEYLGPEDARNVAEMSRAFRDVCKPKLDHYGKVRLRPSHAHVRKKFLTACAREIDAPRTTFGRGLATLWAWFRERELSGRSLRTLDLHLVNQWTWAWNAYAEFKWIGMPLELRSWSTAFGCGIRSLQHLRDLRLDGLPLTNGALLGISQHPTLRGLHAVACGIPLEHETPVLPSLRQIRRLVVSCDPASAYETASAARLVGLVPNVVRLRMESRREDGPLPLSLVRFWKNTPLRAVQDITLRDVDADTVATILGGCLSQRVEEFHLRFYDVAAQAEVARVLAKLGQHASYLRSLVLDGILPPTASWLADLTDAFSGLTDLGLLARPVLGSGRSSTPWDVSPAAVADAICGASCLERFCVNIPGDADAIPPTFDCPSAPDEGGRDGDGTPGSSSLPFPKAAMLIATRFETMRQVVYAHPATATVANIRRAASDPKVVLELLTIMEGRSDCWWRV